MSEQTTYTTRRQITALVVFLFILLSIIVAIVFSDIEPKEARLTISASIGIFAIVVLNGIRMQRGKSIVLTNDGIGYYATAYIIDQDRKAKVDHLRLRWADIEYLSADQRRRELILKCHLADGRVVELTPNNIDPKAASAIFERHHAYTKSPASNHNQRLR